MQSRVKKTQRQMRFKPFLTLSLTGNVRLLANKMDKFGTLMRGT